MNSPPRILIVDDEPDTVEILSRQLKEAGYEILKAYSGKESLEMVKRHNPDLMLMDINMPDMDGFEATKLLKERAGRGFLPIIMVTATGDDTGSVVRGLECGADEYITLPCEKEIILARIQSMLRIKHLHDELDNANMLKILFLAGMAHELRTPVSIIQGFVNLLLEDKTLASAQIRDLKHIETAVQDLIHFTKEILALSKIIAGKVKLGREEFKLEPLINSGINSVMPNLRKKHIKLIKTIDKTIPMLNTDMVRLRQIINNLLTNAVKFTKKGEVTVNCRMDEKGMVNISISDTGIGIKKKLLPYIFEEFRTPTPEKGKKRHGGLGLSISKHIAHLIGGDILVESTVGKGSKFALIFPPGLKELR